MTTLRSIVISPVAVALLYGTFAGLGAVAVILGVPTFALTFSGAFAPIWGVVMVVVSGFAMLGLLSGRERMEKWSVLSIAVLVGFYLGAALNLISQGGEDARSRGAFGVVLLVMMWFPVVQFLRLRKGPAAP